MNLRGPSSSRGTNMHFRASQGVPMPPGATRSTNSAAARHPLPSLAAVMSAPERRNMPHLHPQRLNGALWFDIHVCITKDIVATYQSDFWGPWWNFGMVPLSKKDSWWTSFVQKYYWSSEHHDQVLHCWEDTLKDSIRNLVSKRKRNGKKPDYIGLSDWNRMLDIWETERAKERSQTNSKNRKSDPEGLGTHRHVSGAKKHTRVAYEMSIEAGGVAPPATEVVRRTHTRKDGTFIDKKAEALLLRAQNLATQRCSANETESTITGPSHNELTAAYIEMATNSKGRIYGLGSIQYLNVDPNEAASASLLRNLDIDTRITKMEDNAEVMKRAMDVLLRLNGIDPVTLEPTGHAPSRAEGASSAGSPSPRSNSVAGPAQPTNPRSPINLADMTPQSVEGFEFEDRH